VQAKGKRYTPTCHGRLEPSDAIHAAGSRRAHARARKLALPLPHIHGNVAALQADSSVACGVACLVAVLEEEALVWVYIRCLQLRNSKEFGAEQVCVPEEATMARAMRDLFGEALELGDRLA